MSSLHGPEPFLDPSSDDRADVVAFRPASASRSELRTRLMPHLMAYAVRRPAFGQVAPWRPPGTAARLMGCKRAVDEGNLADLVRRGRRRAARLDDTAISCVSWGILQSRGGHVATLWRHADARGLARNTDRRIPGPSMIGSCRTGGRVTLMLISADVSGGADVGRQPTTAIPGILDASVDEARRLRVGDVVSCPQSSAHARALNRWRASRRPIRCDSQKVQGRMHLPDLS